MLVIHLNNGDVVTMHDAHYTRVGNSGRCFYNNKNEQLYIGSLTNNGDFIDARTSRVTIEKSRDFTAHEIIHSLEAKRSFSYRENELLGKLKRLLRGYKPSSNKYIK